MMIKYGSMSITAIALTILISTGHADWTKLNGTASTFWYVGLAADGHGKVYLYESTGGSGTGFWQYDIVGNFWTQLPNTPVTGHGAFLAADTVTRLVYWHSGNQGFYVFDPGSNGWTALTPTPVPAWSGGFVMTNSDMCCNPVTRKIYWHNGDRAFYEYNIDSDTWVQKDSVPVSGNGDMVVHPGQNKVYWHQGFDPHTGHQNGFYGYDVQSDTWTALAPTPVTCANGGLAIIPALGKIYWSRGGLSADFLEYDIAGDIWTSLGTTPKTGQFGNLAADWTAGLVYYYAGNGVPGDSIFWKYTSPTSINDDWNGAAVPFMMDVCSIMRGRDLEFVVRMGSPGPVQMQFISSDGRLLIHRKLMLEKGDNKVNIGLKDAVQGVYFLRLGTAHNIICKKMIILKS